MVDLNNKNLLNEIIYRLKPTKESPIYIGRNLGAHEWRPLSHLIDYRDSTNVSRDHAEIWIEDNIAFIVDKDSSNGTKVNGAEIKGAGIKQLNNNDTVSFGSYSYVIQTSFSIGKTSDKHIGVCNPMMANIENDQPTWDNPLHIGRRFPDDKRKLLFDLSEDGRVSRKHAIIWIEGKKLFIKDAGSTNGTFVNDKDISLHGTIELKSGDEVRFGSTQYVIGDFSIKKPIPQKPLTPPKDTLIQLLDIKQQKKKKVSDRIKGKKGNEYILQNANLRVEAEDFILIMGPSGCGKSTLLKIMCGESSASEGDVVYFIKGQKKYIRPDWPEISRYIGYVPQKDILHKGLTAREELKYAAQLRMGNTTEEEREKRISDVINELNIANCIENKKLSGGQEKRVCIAIELLTKPTFLYLDEPTSPLDPGAMEDLMECLKKLNAKGTTIIMVSHKQEDLKYANKVLFLGTNGYQTYYDYTGFKLDEWFGVNHPKEIYEKINSKEKAKKWSDKYYKYKQTQGVTDRRDKIDRTGAIVSTVAQQIKILTKRLFREQFNAPTDFLKQIIGAFCIALFVAFFNEKIDITLLFWAAITATFLGISNTMSSIVEEADIYNREKMTVVNNFSYLTSKLVYALFISLVEAIVVVCIFGIAYNMLRSDIPIFNIGYFFLLYWYMVVSASMLGLLISAGVNKVKAAFNLLPLILVLQIILSGVIKPIEDKGFELFSYASICRWGTEGFARIQNKIEKDTINIKNFKTDKGTINKTIYLKQPDTLLYNIKTDKLYIPKESKSKDLKSRNPLIMEYDTINIKTYDTLPQTEKKIKSIYQPSKVANKDTAYLKHGAFSPKFTDTNRYEQINALDILPSTHKSNLYKLFNGFWYNMLALSILNIICFGLAYLFLRKKTRI